MSKKLKVKPDGLWERCIQIEQALLAIEAIQRLQSKQEVEKLDGVIPFVLETEFEKSEPLVVTVEGFANGKLVLSDTKTYHAAEFLTLPSKQDVRIK